MGSRVMLALMTRTNGMLERAEMCEELADKARNPHTAWALRDAAHHWRTVAVRTDLLEREPAYRMLRVRPE